MSNTGLELIETNLKLYLETHLRRSGVLYRLFSRIKEPISITEKLKRKNYEGENKLMQDIIGFRIITYFEDDVKFLFYYFKEKLDHQNHNYDTPQKNEFNPLRKNLVCRFENENLVTFNEIKNSNNEFKLIDSTFEIQFRTTLSEGWHEVEHSMRYKRDKEWENLDNESRMLNGIYATIETSEFTLKSLFDNISYHHYKNKNWEAMIRNKFRLRFNMETLHSEIIELFNSNNEIAKKLFKVDRCNFIEKVLYSNLRIKISFNNIVYIFNYLFIKNDAITNLTPRILLDDFNTELAIKLD